VRLAPYADVRYYVRISVPSQESVVSRLRFTQDVRPVTEFRANASAFLDQVRETRRPVVLTQHGRSAAVLLNVDVYEGLLDQVALLRDVKTAEGQVAAGKTVAHATVAKRLRDKLLK
jgi:antitoxin YefM